MSQTNEKKPPSVLTLNSSLTCASSDHAQMLGSLHLSWGLFIRLNGKNTCRCKVRVLNQADKADSPTVFSYAAHLCPCKRVSRWVL